MVWAKDVGEKNITTYGIGSGLGSGSNGFAFGPLAKLIEWAVEAVWALGFADPPAKSNQVNMELHGGVFWKQRAQRVEGGIGGPGLDDPKSIGHAVDVGIHRANIATQGEHQDAACGFQANAGNGGEFGKHGIIIQDRKGVGKGDGV